MHSSKGTRRVRVGVLSGMVAISLLAVAAQPVGADGNEAPGSPLAPRAIAAGDRFTCAILADGTVRCWGMNAAGQLGLGDTLARGDAGGEMGANLPAVDLGTGRTATAIAAGTRHACALLDEGSVKCWGANIDDALGQVTGLNIGDNPGEIGDALPPIDLPLPATAITVVRRSDGSGTTFNFTDYLSKANAEWKAKVGQGTAVEWPTGVGAKGNEGVAGNVGQTKNSIGYVEYAYAKQNKLTYAAMTNKAGKTVQPTIASFQAAASNADWAKAPGYYVILTDQPGDASWPITAATFILMHKTPVDKAASAEAIKFFKWSFEKGGKMAEDLDYIPMPEPVVKLIEKTWSSDIKS